VETLAGLLGMRLSADEVAGVLACMDANGDGAIGEQEFKVRGRGALTQRTGAGGDYGIGVHKSWLRFPYDSTFWRAYYLHPHP
jgi:hypothetical protein